MKVAALNAILSEVQSLRLEVALFLPTESVNGFTNKNDILTALKNARG